MKPFLKICSKCRKQKWNTEFHINKSKKSGLASKCKECENKHLQKQRQEYYRNKPNYHRINNLRRSFGITLEEYKLMSKSQNGVCKICKQPETAKLNGKVKHLAIDHNPETGKIRGLLCGNCNQMLGKVKDDPEILKQAIKYLEENQ